MFVTTCDEPPDPSLDKYVCFPQQPQPNAHLPTSGAWQTRNSTGSNLHLKTLGGNPSSSTEQRGHDAGSATPSAEGPIKRPESALLVGKDKVGDVL